MVKSIDILDKCQIRKRTFFSMLFVLFCISCLSTFPVKNAAAAALANLVSQPTNNIVTVKAGYEILFTTTTTGIIKTVTVAFPNGFVLSPILIERSGIGAGTLSVSGTTITYTVSGIPSVVLAKTPIRLEFANIIQRSVPGPSQITITTKGPFGTIIDGPTASNTSLIQLGRAAIADGAVGTNQIADRAVTNSKIQENSIDSKQIQRGAVPLTSSVVFGPQIQVPAGWYYSTFSPPCPSGYVASGSSFEGLDLELVYSFQTGTQWAYEVYNPTSQLAYFSPGVVCLTVTTGP
jgi:hypothetical protein